MRRKIALAFVLSLALSGTLALTHQHRDHGDEIKTTIAGLMDSALVTFVEAVEIALAAHPGDAVGAELEGDYVDGKMVALYEIGIAGNDGVFYEVTLDSRDGRMLKEITEYEDHDTAEYQEFNEALQAAWLGLNACIRKAEAEGKGRAVEAELEIDDGIPVCEVVTFDGETLHEIELDMRNGNVIEIELRDFDEDDDEDEDEDDEEEEEHEHGRHRGHHDDHD